MKDHFGRNIDYMRISVTDRCNLRCRYCMPNGIEWLPMSEILTLDEILEIVRTAVPLGITKFKVTGGEPLVRFNCAWLIGEIGKVPGVREVTMTTNGVQLADYLPALKEAGLRHVNVSLDTLKPDVFKEITGRDNLAAVLRGIHAAIDAGMQVKVNTVLQKDLNESEWPALAALAQELPVDVRFIEMMPIGYGRESAGINNRQLLELLRKQYPGMQEDTRTHGNGPAVYYEIPGFRGTVGFISAIHGKFCGECNRIRLSSIGRIKPCLCFNDSVDLRGILRDAEFSPAERREELKRAIEKAVSMKPESHTFEKPQSVTEEKQMVQIGG